MTRPNVLARGTNCTTSCQSSVSGKIEKKKRLNDFNLIKNLILLLIWKSEICQKDKQEKNLKKWS